MKYALNNFTLYPNEPVLVQGNQTLYSYQNAADAVALIQGSNDAVNWIDIVSIPINGSAVEQHSYKFLRMLGNTTITVNRGNGSNTSGNGSNGDSIPNSEKGAVLGVATLGADAKVPVEQLPTLGGGFAYGGEFNAIPASTYVDAAFDVLQFCTDSGSTLTPLSASPYGAMITNISDADAGTDRKVRFTWPDTSGGNAFFVGFAVTESHYPVNEVSSPSSTIIGIGAMDGANILLTKQAQNSGTSPLANINVGDVIVIGYRAAIQMVYITNETQDGSPVTTISLSSYPAFTDTPMSLMVYSTVAAGINYNFNDPFNYNLQRELLEFYIPSDLAKTYHVEAASYKSVIHGKLLKEGDFVNFFDEGTGAIDVAISRLIGNADIAESLGTELQNPSSVAYLAVQNTTNAAIQAALLTEGTGVIYNAIESAINAYALGIGVGGQSAYTTVDGVIDAELQTGGIIDNAIQAAINP